MPQRSKRSKSLGTDPRGSWSLGASTQLIRRGADCRYIEQILFVVHASLRTHDSEVPLARCILGSRRLAAWMDLLAWPAWDIAGALRHAARGSPGARTLVEADVPVVTVFVPALAPVVGVDPWGFHEGGVARGLAHLGRPVVLCNCHTRNTSTN